MKMFTFYFLASAWNQVERCVKTQLLEKNMLNLRSLDPLIDLAFEEDIGIGDITTEATVPSTQEGVGTLLAKSGGIVAGLPVPNESLRN